jgi:hypothetical protein
MKIYETGPDGNLIEANSKRVRFAVDDRGAVVEEYEEFTDYGVAVAENLSDLYNERAESAKERMKKNRRLRWNT